MLSLVQVTVVGGPPVVTQVNVKEGGSVIGSSGSNWNEMSCCRSIRPAWIMHVEHGIYIEHVDGKNTTNSMYVVVSPVFR